MDVSPTDYEGVKGWNWGRFMLNSTDLEFRCGSQTAFRLPYSGMTQAVLQGEAELGIEFKPGRSDREADVESLVEMRVFVPKKDTADDGNDFSSVDSLYDRLQQAAELGVSRKDAIVAFPELRLLTPRGKYELYMHREFFTLRGKSYTYSIRNAQARKLFMFQRDDGSVTFLISLDPPIRQGQTTYDYLVFAFDDTDESEVTVDLPETEIRARFQDQLALEMVGPTYDIVSRVFKCLLGRKVVVPDGKFKSRSDTESVRCSLKAQDGSLYPLNKSLFWLHKPPTYVRHRDISAVSFNRIVHSGGQAQSASTRTFDLVVTEARGETHTFTGIAKREFRNLFHYCKTKELAILEQEQLDRYLDLQTAAATSGTRRSARQRTTEYQTRTIQDTGEDLDDEESDDDDFTGHQSESSSEEDEYHSEVEAPSGAESATDAPDGARSRGRRGREAGDGDITTADNRDVADSEESSNDEPPRKRSRIE